MTEIIVTSSVLILLLIVLRQILRRRIDPRVQYALWLLVAARLLIPGTLFTAPVSVMGAAEDIQTAIQQTGPGPHTPDMPGLSPEVVVPVSSAAAPVENAAFSLPGFDMQETRKPDWPDLIWKTGIAVVGGAMVLSNLAFYLRLRKNRKRMDLPNTPWTRELTVYGSKKLPSPCLFGIFRPAIYLNRAAMCAEHPEHILAHEYAHYRHRDHLWSVLRCICVAVHWYNPLVWWAAALSRQDCELACDASALRQLGEEEAIDYGHTLLSMISRSRNPAALLRTATTMTAGKRTMKQRITLIIQRPKMRKVTLALVALLTVCLAACAFGHAMDATTEPSGDLPVSVTVSQTLSSQLDDTSHITEPDEVARLWELYQSFEYEGTYDPTGKGGWFVSVYFQFGDEPNDDTDIYFILTRDGIHTKEGESLLLKNIEEIYAEFLRMSKSNPIQPMSVPETEEVLANNARSIIEMIRQGKDVSEWLPLLNYMDWRVLSQAAVEAGMDNGDGSAAEVNIIGQILEYVEENGPSMTTGQYLYILSASDGLDGAPAEGYSYLAYRMYDRNPIQFAYVVLEMLPEEQKNEVLDYFRSEWYYHRISDSPDLPTREEAIAHLEVTQADAIFATPTEMVLRGAGSTFQFQVFNVSGFYALTYESSDPDVAVVDASGIVTATGPGEAVITAHLEGGGGVRNFSCAVRCDWDDNTLPVPGPEDPSADIAQYSELIMGWQRAVGPSMGMATAAPDQQLIYDDLTEDGLRNAVVSRLEQHGKSLYPNDSLAFDHIKLLEEPALYSGQTKLTVQYQVICKASLDLPNGQVYDSYFGSEWLTTTFTVMPNSNVMGSMLVDGAMGNLPGAAGNLSDLSGEITNQWQQGFSGFTLAIPPMPDQTLDDASGDNLQTALSMLGSYYQDYVLKNGSSQYNDRFNRIIYEGVNTEATASGVKLEVLYQVECLRDREYEGKTYTLAPQPGDHLATAFTFLNTSDTSDLDSESATQFDQWVQSYLSGVSAAPEGIAGYDSADERSLYDQVHSHLYPYVSAYFAGDFAANCYAYDVQLAFSVPNEVPTSQFTLNYYVIVMAAARLPSGEIHNVKLTSRELTTTVTVADTAD